MTVVPPASNPTALPYGQPISLTDAKRVMETAATAAMQGGYNVVIAIVDTGGHLVLLQRLDNTQFGSVEVAQAKARAAVAFRRPTRLFQDLIADGGVHLRLLNLTGDAGVLEGGVPIVVDGSLIGAIGVSGVTSAQDGSIAEAGAAALAQ